MDKPKLPKPLFLDPMVLNVRYEYAFMAPICSAINPTSKAFCFLLNIFFEIHSTFKFKYKAYLSPFPEKSSL